MASYTYVATSSYVTAASGGNVDMSTATGLGSRTAGNLLLLTTGARAGTITGITISGYTELLKVGTTAAYIGVFGRICTATSDDLPTTVDWDGATGWQYGVINEFSGDIWTTLSTIVAHSNTEISSTSTLPLPVVPAAGSVTTADCLIFAASQKNATGAITSITHSTLTVETGMTRTTTNSNYMHVANAYRQETTAADYDGTDFTINGGSETSLACRAIVLYLKTQAASGTFITPNTAALSV